MNILVYDIAASGGGALTVLEDFYQQAVNYPDKSIIWYLNVSTPLLKDTDTVKILAFPWVKKSWFHRIFFDLFCGPVILKKYKIEKILSLQNTAMYRTHIPQTVFLQNCLSLIDYHFSFIQDRRLWLYKYFIGKVTIHSLGKAEKVVVQTQWMKDLCLEKLEINKDKLTVIPTTVHVRESHCFDYNKAYSHFFFPAFASSYKNHLIILKAASILVKKGIKDFDIQFTINPGDNKCSKMLFEYTATNNLPVKWLGQISQEKVYEAYEKNILIFPSFFESYGLPLYEARKIKTIIFASKLPYALEALSSYHNSYFFDVYNEKELSSLMEQAISRQLTYSISDTVISDTSLSLCTIMQNTI